MRVLLTAFDTFPSAKGASAHIAHNLAAISRFAKEVTLACPGAFGDPMAQSEDGITILRCPMTHPNFLFRAESFGQFVSGLLGRTGAKWDVIHFRDIWGGIPALHHPTAGDKLKIFEVNGLASIEAPYRYPAVAHSPSLLGRIREMEDFCLKGADKIITVSQVNADHIASRGVPRSRITVIPNTSAIGSATIHRGDPGSKNRILYSGSLAPWQGVDTLLRAFALLAPRGDVRLTLAASNKKFLKPHMELAARLGIQEEMEVKMAIGMDDLATLYNSSAVSVAPLARDGRNLRQGACPIKIFDSMAMGTPLVASDIPITREILEDGVDSLLVRPDSPRALAMAITRLLDDSALAESLGAAARDKFEIEYSMTVFFDKLKNAYQEAS